MLAYFHVAAYRAHKIIYISKVLILSNGICTHKYTHLHYVWVGLNKQKSLSEHISREQSQSRAPSSSRRSEVYRNWTNAYTPNEPGQIRVGDNWLVGLWHQFFKCITFRTVVKRAIGSATRQMQHNFSARYDDCIVLTNTCLEHCVKHRQSNTIQSSRYRISVRICDFV